MFKRTWYWINRRRLDSELAQELEEHRAMRQADLERSGLSPTDASQASRRVLGNVTLALEDAREIWSWTLVEHLVRDCRYALRALRREPTFAITAVTTLGLAVAVTTAIFGVVHAALWKPLPFPSPDRLMAIDTTGPGQRSDQASGQDVLAWRESTHGFADIAAFSSSRRRIARGPNGPESLATFPVTPNFFRTLQVSPGIGRWFDPDARRGGAEAVLTDACWRRMFDGDPQVVGKNITLDDLPQTIVGVAAPDFRLEFMPAPDLFRGLRPDGRFGLRSAKLLDSRQARRRRGDLHGGARAAGRCRAARARLPGHAREAGRSSR